jgi:hypothetical protein
VAGESRKQSVHKPFYLKKQCVHKPFYLKQQSVRQCTCPRWDSQMLRSSAYQIERGTNRLVNLDALAGRGVLPWAIEAQEPGEIDRLLLRGRSPNAGLRVHELRQLGEPPLQK